VKLPHQNSASIEFPKPQAQTIPFSLISSPQVPHYQTGLPEMTIFKRTACSRIYDKRHVQQKRTLFMPSKGYICSSLQLHKYLHQHSQYQYAPTYSGQAIRYSVYRYKIFTFDGNCKATKSSRDHLLLQNNDSEARDTHWLTQFQTYAIKKKKI